MEIFKRLIKQLIHNRIYWILSLALILRLSLFLYIQIVNPGAIWTQDSGTYHKPALNLLHHHVFSQSDSPPFEPETRRTPGYPMMISLIYLFTGEHPSIVVIFQVVLNLLLIFLIFKLGLILFDERSALLAALLLAVDSLQILYSNVLLTETLFTLLLGCFSFSIIKVLEHKRVTLKVMSASFFLAVATMVRPMSYYLPIPVAIGILIYILKTDGFKTTVICTVVFALVQLFIIGGWQLRNRIKTGSWEYSSMAGHGLLFDQAAPVIARRDNISIEDVKDLLGYHSPPDEFYPGMSNIEISQAKKKRGLEIIKKHPWIYARVYCNGVLRTIFGPGLNTTIVVLQSLASHEDYFEKYQIIKRSKLLHLFSFLGVGYLIFLYVGFSIGMLNTKQLNITAIIFILGLVAYIIAITGAVGYSRYRVPIMPYILLFASHGFCRIAQKLSIRNYKKSK